MIPTWHSTGWVRRLVPALLFAAVGLGCQDEGQGGGDRPSSAGRPNVILITVDTLRADRLGSYGYRLDTSPNVDALASKGVRFADATVQWPKTWPSMASLLTGKFPHTTGLGVVPRVLPAELALLPELFGAAGYESAAVVANFNVGRSLGFDQGFDHFVESWQEKWAEHSDDAYVNAPGRVKQFTNATLVTDQALRWLWGRPDADRPFFLWLHYMDPHGPYLPPPAYRSLFEGAHASKVVPPPLIPSYQRQQAGGTLITDLAHYQAHYDREIRYFDDELGRLFEQLEHLDLGDSVIVLTADHGESLGEHNYYLEHGMLSYQPTAHVPLIVTGPGVGPAGRVIDSPVGLVDLSPTLLELAGLDVPDDFEGTSLFAQVTGDRDGDLPEHVFMQAGRNEAAPQLSVREGKWKLIQVQGPLERGVMKGTEYELYDLEADPGELRNVAMAHPDVLSRLAGILEDWYGDGMPGASKGRAIQLDVEKLDPRSREMLRSLGYIE